ncbi:hypothetical protein MTBBW1_600061 [Desulfamplus magnetovallimortis]|uniref:Uncharacterized protein n=1 Tax=Desulfamplus magnetovallimortis TaxID=1246637 RepID=A0A1W1HI97_9BACT|nr:hypothetical protein MTBBW1_600061 [Desulfamplus magnetovallimortis]
MIATIEKMKVVLKTGCYRDFHIKPFNSIYWHPSYHTKKDFTLSVTRSPKNGDYVRESVNWQMKDAHIFLIIIKMPHTQGLTMIAMAGI